MKMQACAAVVACLLMVLSCQGGSANWERNERAAVPIESPSQAPPEPVSIGTATMNADETIVLDLRADATGQAVGHARFTYPKTHPQYQDTLEHVGGLKPGETKSVVPWPDQE